MYFYFMRVNIITKKTLLSIILILLSSFAIASPVEVVSDVGIVNLTIINRPPVITDIFFSPDSAFEDSKLECIAIINDENLDEIQLVYKWYINNELIETKENYLTGFNENDLVKCEVTPIDNKNVSGETKNILININKRSALSAITGFIVKNYKEDFSLPLTFFFSVLLFGIFLIIAINLNSILKRKTKN